MAFHGLPDVEPGLADCTFQHQEISGAKLSGDRETSHRTRNSGAFLINDLIDNAKKEQKEEFIKKKGTLTGVVIPVCENMWGVLIFLRFFIIVGQAGVGESLVAVVVSFLAALCTAQSMSAIADSGGMVSGGGPYFMISRALGPVVGISVGMMKWLAVTMLSVLETLGAVEALCMAVPELDFPYHKQALGSSLLAAMAVLVWGGINVVSKLGAVFALVVLFTVVSYYVGLFAVGTGEVPHVEPLITGLSLQTLRENWYPHYSPGYDFGVIMSLFYPCFTGILSGASRADVLKDPPKSLRRGTFAAIIISFFMYSSFFILWGSVANYKILQGQSHGAEGHGDGEEANRIIQLIVWNPFPKSAYVGIIIASVSQALQCLIVAPRLLRSIAKDRLIPILGILEPVSARGEPVRALIFTYLVAASLVLIGELDAVAPLLTMCFLVTYAFMNLSCFAMTWLKSATWRPVWITKKRWRAWYLFTCGAGTALCLSIMIIVNPLWALVACVIASVLYFYVNWRLEERKWGSAMDGIKFKLALSALIQLEGSQYQRVNWRPQVLILYGINLSKEELGVKHREILRFCSQLRKGIGFSVAACVLEAPERNQETVMAAAREKDLMKTIMKEEGLEGFAEVVVAPTWEEGTNYIIQLTGIGGLVPNAVMVDWPLNWETDLRAAKDFVKVLSHADDADKAVLAVKGLNDMPVDAVQGTIDIWWMIHDGGLLILLSWLLSQHKTWRNCALRVFSLAENVSEERAKAAAELLTRTLREKRLFDVDVEVILADDDMIEPYTYDWTLRVEERNYYLDQLRKKTGQSNPVETLPLEIDELFHLESEIRERREGRGGQQFVQAPPQRQTSWGSGRQVNSHTPDACEDRHAGRVAVSDCRTAVDAVRHRGPHDMDRPNPCHEVLGRSFMCSDEEKDQLGELPSSAPAPDQHSKSPRRTSKWESVDSCAQLNSIVLSRSHAAQLVVMNLPGQWGTEHHAVLKYMTYCDTLTRGLDRVLFVHSTGHVIPDLFD